jgi:nucleotide-binding universal stress UspA family protein
MAVHNPRFRVTLDNVLVATDFSPASAKAVLYATAIARRHSSKLFLVHVVTSRSESALMDGWRAGQAEVTKQLIADHLDGIEHELVVRAGDVWQVLSGVLAEKHINLVVVGTRGRTGMRKMLLGSVAEIIFRKATVPVLTIGPNVKDQDPEMGPEKILAPTGFAAQSLSAVRYAVRLAQDLQSHLALLNVVTDVNPSGGNGKDTVAHERSAKLRALVPADVQLPSEPLFFVQFGSPFDLILQTAAQWEANLIVLGIREKTSGKEPTWAKAYDIISNASCPVLTIREPN